MRTKSLVAIFVALAIVAAAVVNLQAQQQPAPGQMQQGPPGQPAARPTGPPRFPNGVAVIDVTYILDNFVTLKQSMEAWNAAVKKQGDDLRKEQEGLMKMEEQLRGLKPGNQDYKNLEEQLAKRAVDFKVKAQLAEKNFQEQKAKRLFRAYGDISNAVKAYSDMNNITLVIRINNSPVDQNNFEAVRADMLKMVQYNSKEIDITQTILDALNRTATAARPPAANPGQPQQR